MRGGAVALVLAFSACAAAPEAERPPSFTPDADGIAIVGSPLRIDFGRAELGAVAAVSRLEGEAPRQTVLCGDGVRAVRWASGLSLHFREGAFLGWSVADGTAAGIGCAVSM